MATQLYPSFRQLLGLGTAPDLATITIGAALVLNTYTPTFATDAFLSDVTSGKIAASVDLASVTLTLGTLNAASPSDFGTVSGSTPINAIVLYKDTGTLSTSTLIAYIDNAGGFPFTPTGGDVQITWDSGTNKIFTI